MVKFDILNNYKLLSKSDDNYLLYKKGKLFFQNKINSEPEFACKLSLSNKYDLLSNIRITERILRLEPRCAIRLENQDFLISYHGGVYRLESDNKTLICEHKYREGMNNPLSFCGYYDDNKNENCILYGEYFGNMDKEGVSIFARINSEWKRVYEFERGTITHIHNIIFDKYRNNFIILTGDSDSESGIWQASIDFRKVNPLLLGKQIYRSCIAFPIEEGLIYATDTPLTSNAIYYLDINNKSFYPIKLFDMPGPCIYGTSVFNHNGKRVMVFATSVEPDSRIKGWRYRLTYKLGEGVKERKTHIIMGNKEIGFRDVVDIEKDIWPMLLCQFGNIQFPNIVENSYVYMTPIALKKYDGKTVRLKI